MNRIRRGASRYAAWTKRQASATNCGGGAAAGLIALAVVALLTLVYWPVIWPVLVVIFWTVVSVAGAALLGWIAAAIVAGRRRAALRAAPAPARLRPMCADCGTRPAAAEVTYANGRRADTVYTCDECWRAEEARAAVPPEFYYAATLMTSRLPAYHEVPPEPSQDTGPRTDHMLPFSGPDPVRQLPDADAEVPIAPDNRPASNPGTASDLAAVLARTGQWTRSHP